MVNGIVSLISLSVFSFIFLGSIYLSVIRFAHIRKQDYFIVLGIFGSAEEMSKRVLSLLKQKNAQLNIGTFHSICSRLLRKEIHRLGFTRDFVIYDVQNQIALIRLVMDGMK